MFCFLLFLFWGMTFLPFFSHSEGFFKENPPSTHKLICPTCFFSLGIPCVWVLNILNLGLPKFKAYVLLLMPRVLSRILNSTMLWWVYRWLPMLIMWSSKFSQFVNSKSSNVLFLAGMSCICGRKQSSVTCRNLMGKLCNTTLFSQQVTVMKTLHQGGACSIDTKLLQVAKLKFSWPYHSDWKVIKFQFLDDPSNLDRNSIEL